MDYLTVYSEEDIFAEIRDASAEEREFFDRIYARYLRAGYLGDECQLNIVQIAKAATEHLLMRRKVFGVK